MAKSGKGDKLCGLQPIKTNNILKTYHILNAFLSLGP